MTHRWREHAKTPFDCEKRPATGAGGMVVTNHPLASAAGAEMLAAGGNAIDAAIASLFTLTVVEPMMVGVLGGGMTHVRLASGRHCVVDGLSTAPLAATADMYRPVSDSLPDYLETEGRENAVGAKAVAAPGNLAGWCAALERFGTFSLADVVEPAIRHASRGFRVTPYLTECIEEAGRDLALDPTIAAVYLPGGRPAAAGTRLAIGEYADTLRAIASEGPTALYHGSIGAKLTDHLQREGGRLAPADLTGYRTIEREPVRGTYRGYEIVGPPPPSSGGVHVVQMLNILEGYDLRAMGFGSVESLHLLAEVLKIAFADRRAATADPDFVEVPVARLLSKTYADERRTGISEGEAATYANGLGLPESPNTTHLTVADRDGNVVASTQTINNTFGARIMIPEIGLVPNNYMHIFDPHPGHALSIAPGKRVTTSQSPVIVLSDDRPILALGLPGGLRIFGSVMQALVNVIDHRMTVQEAVEAPRMWTQGDVVEAESGFPASVRAGLAARGHHVVEVPHVGGGMCAIGLAADGELTGAACWRADGTALAVGGGLAREGSRFWPEQANPSART